MPRLTADQCRAARALLDWSQGQLADKSTVSRETITAFERGKAQPFDRTLDDLIDALHDAGIELIDGADDGTGHGVRWRRGFGPSKLLSPGKTSRSARRGGLDAAGLDYLDAWEAKDSDLKLPPPLEWSDEEKRAQIQHWRSQPEKWAALHRSSQQCLLQAMGVEHL